MWTESILQSQLQATSKLPNKTSVVAPRPFPRPPKLFSIVGVQIIQFSQFSTSSPSPLVLTFPKHPLLPSLLRSKCSFSKGLTSQLDATRHNSEVPCNTGEDKGVGARRPVFTCQQCSLREVTKAVMMVTVMVILSWLSHGTHVFGQKKIWMLL